MLDQNLGLLCVRWWAHVRAGHSIMPKPVVALPQARDLGIFRYDFAGTAMDGEAVVVRVWLKAVKQRQEVRSSISVSISKSILFRANIRRRCFQLCEGWRSRDAVLC